MLQTSARGFKQCCNLSIHLFVSYLLLKVKHLLQACSRWDARLGLQPPILDNRYGRSPHVTHLHRLISCADEFYWQAYSSLPSRPYFLKFDYQLVIIVLLLAASVWLSVFVIYCSCFQCIWTMAVVMERSIFTDSHAKSILSTMNNLRKSNTLCDVTLYVDGCQFPVHRIVLAACSDYFCAMFTHQVLCLRQYHIFTVISSLCCLLLSPILFTMLLVVVYTIQCC